MEFTPLQEVVAQADLIVIGKRHKPPFFNDNKGNEGPGTIEVRIERTLKGSGETDIIKVSSWAGMCAYGITLHKETALLLLKKTDYRGEDGRALYTPPDFCGEKQFTIIDGWLTRRHNRGTAFVDEPFMSIDEFIGTYLNPAALNHHAE